LATYFLPALKENKFVTSAFLKKNDNFGWKTRF